MVFSLLLNIPRQPSLDFGIQNPSVMWAFYVTPVHPVALGKLLHIHFLCATYTQEGIVWKKKKKDHCKVKFEYLTSLKLPFIVYGDHKHYSSSLSHNCLIFQCLVTLNA